LPLFDRYGYAEMIKCLTIKTLPSCRSYRYSPLVVLSTTVGGPRPLYGGLCMFGSYGKGYFFPTWMAVELTDWCSSLSEITIAHFDM
jgi:hypothetical protein